MKRLVADHESRGAGVLYCKTTGTSRNLLLRGPLCRTPLRRHQRFLKENIRVEGKRDIQTKVMTTLFALFAEVERDLISERTSEGLAKARASGRKLGRPKGSLGVSRLDGKEDEIRDARLGEGVEHGDDLTQRPAEPGAFADDQTVAGLQGVRQLVQPAALLGSLSGGGWVSRTRSPSCVCSADSPNRRPWRSTGKPVVGISLPMVKQANAGGNPGRVNPRGS